MKNREKQKPHFIIEVEPLRHNKSSQIERLLSYVRKTKENVRAEK